MGLGWQLREWRADPGAQGGISFIVANYRNCSRQNNSTSKTIIILQPQTYYSSNVKTDGSDIK